MSGQVSVAPFPGGAERGSSSLTLSILLIPWEVSRWPAARFNDIWLEMRCNVRKFDSPSYVIKQETVATFPGGAERGSPSLTLSILLILWEVS